MPADRQDDLNPASDLAPFADALKRLAPQPAHLSRDALLFEAGKASAGPALAPWVWPSVAGFFAALSFILAAFLIAPDSHGAPEIQYQVVTVPQQAPEPAATPGNYPETTPKSKPAKSEDYTETARLLRQKRDVLRWGVDMLPESKPAAKGPSQDVAARELTHWLDLPPGTFALPAAQLKKPAPKTEDEDK
jgi:hypothetical protein